jgi:hypothetical protein
MCERVKVVPNFKKKLSNFKLDNSLNDQPSQLYIICVAGRPLEDSNTTYYCTNPKKFSLVKG